MYKLGAVVCLFVVMLVGACGCSVAVPGTGPVPGAASGATPTLPATYIAGESTPSAESFAVTSTPTPPENVSANIVGVQVNYTLTVTPINCNGQSCTSGSNATTINTTSANPSAPISSFSANVTKGYPPPSDPVLYVQFTDTSANGPTSWLWNFGDSVTNTTQNPVYMYNGYNYYDVSLSATNSYGSSQSTAVISVCPLIVSFTTSQTTGLVPLTVQFTDTSTGQPTSWNWNFGDGGTSHLQNPTHKYTTSGDYTVRLDATNNLGSCWYTSTISVSPLAASFTTNLTTGLVPLTVQFTDTSTDQPTSWNWNFGDGGTSALQNPIHTYTVAGDYAVNLSATNGYNGWMSSPSSQITVYSLPSVSFTANPTAGTPNTSVIFSDESTGFPSPTSWYWDFGDGYNSTYQNPSHQYTSSGLYTISHSATNSQGTIWLNKTAYISIS